ncbi:hypothetical protein Q1695_000538 [Nippostrongylus brasiliensis]|nr:hypothetical protein Q1695_000538 [Nippostrongylus brasiliensis]
MATLAVTQRGNTLAHSSMAGIAKILITVTDQRYLSYQRFPVQIDSARTMCSTKTSPKESRIDAKVYGPPQAMTEETAVGNFASETPRMYRLTKLISYL